MPQFLVHFAQFHLEFRLPELDSLAVLEKVDLKYDPAAYSNESPFMVVELPSVEDAERLISRSILVKEILELWEVAPSLPEILEKVKTPPSRYAPYKTCSFKFVVQSFGTTIPLPGQISRIESFSFLGFEGPIDLKTPDVTFVYFEDYGNYAERGEKVPEKPRQVLFGRLVGSGGRKVVTKYDLKKREYLGITSMDAELSLVMANQALARPGSFVLDPFVGTGSFLLTCAHYGAFTMGADIDGRQIRGKDNKNIASNTAQYGLAGRVVDNIICDLAHHPWREQQLYDAIVCDPPYVVRAGAKKIGNNPKIRPASTPLKANGEPRYPQTVPYEMNQVLVDLIDFSAKYLIPGGRLVYWLPTVTEEYLPTDVPLHPQFRLISNSEQNFGKWARRLITMEKFVSGGGDGSAEAGTAEPAHSRFRERYFEKSEKGVEGVVGGVEGLTI